jgi:hypothetical protein
LEFEKIRLTVGTAIASAFLTTRGVKIDDWVAKALEVVRAPWLAAFRMNRRAAEDVANMIVFFFLTVCFMPPNLADIVSEKEGGRKRIFPLGWKRSRTEWNAKPRRLRLDCGLPLLGREPDR